MRENILYHLDSPDMQFDAICWSCKAGSLRDGSACISLCIDRKRTSEYWCRERSRLSRCMDRLANTVLAQTSTQDYRYITIFLYAQEDTYSR